MTRLQAELLRKERELTALRVGYLAYLPATAILDAGDVEDPGEGQE